MHETLFFICGGILAASAIVVSFIGLKKDDFPGKLMPLVIAWFAIFAIGAGTFAVLHGKDESKDHDAQYAKASKQIELNETSGPFTEAEDEAREAEEAESGEAGEAEEAESGAGEESAEGEGGGEEEGEGGAEEGGAELESQVGNAGEQLEGKTGESPAGGEAQLGAVVFSENCSVCHGATGHGGNGGPDLRTMPLAQTEEGAIQQVTNGGGGMPAFGGQLTEEQIENVAAYVAQEITGGE
jgi:mono/diheme cytochrome c family protein